MSTVRLITDNVKIFTDSVKFAKSLPYSFHFYAIVNGSRVGNISVRSSLNKFNLNYTGNIGFYVEKEFRGKGYATEMLRQALRWCRIIGINYGSKYVGRANISCLKDNIASRRVIEKNGGVFEKQIIEDVLVFWIPL